MKTKEEIENELWRLIVKWYEYSVKNSQDIKGVLSKAGDITDYVFELSQPEKKEEVKGVEIDPIEKEELEQLDRKALKREISELFVKYGMHTNQVLINEIVTLFENKKL